MTMSHTQNDNMEDTEAKEGYKWFVYRDLASLIISFRGWDQHPPQEAKLFSEGEGLQKLFVEEGMPQLTDELEMVLTALRRATSFDWTNSKLVRLENGTLFTVPHQARLWKGNSWEGYQEIS